MHAHMCVCTASPRTDCLIFFLVFLSKFANILEKLVYVQISTSSCLKHFSTTCRNVLIELYIRELSQSYTHGPLFLEIRWTEECPFKTDINMCAYICVCKYVHMYECVSQNFATPLKLDSHKKCSI